MVIDRTKSAFQLRPYQEHAVQANEDAWAGKRRPTGTGVATRTTNVLATGLGKTVIFSALARRAHERRERTLVLVHRNELAQQARAKLHSVTPGASIGLVKGAANEWDRDIVVASVPSIGSTRQLERRGIPANRFGLIIADECHHSAAETWRTAMGWFGSFRGLPSAGFTATLDRADSKGLGEVWEETVAERDIGYGIREGYLVPVTGRRVRVQNLTLGEVKVNRALGDFQDGDLGDAMEDADAGEAIAKAYLEHASGRRAVMFCPTVKAARHWADDMNRMGVPTEVVTGELDDDSRAAIYERFRTGTTLVISSVMVLTEGWDAPWAEVAIMARPTKSNTLYIQCVGRVLRPFPAGGKRDALVLDVVGASAENKLVSLNNLDLDRDPTNPLYSDEDEVEREPGTPGETMDDPRSTVYGELVAEEVSLFDDSDSAWLQTTAGLWFIPTRASYFYLWPKGDGTFGLGRRDIHGRRGSFGDVLENNLTLEGGMAWAERYAQDEELEAGSGRIGSRTASWRRKPPSEALLRFAAAMRVPTEGLRQGQVSDLVTIAKASQTLPTPKPVRVG